MLHHSMISILILWPPGRPRNLYLSQLKKDGGIKWYLCGIKTICWRSCKIVVEKLNIVNQLIIGWKKNLYLPIL